jgi:hypothetical protein
MVTVLNVAQIRCSPDTERDYVRPAQTSKSSKRIALRVLKTMR